MYMFYFLNNIDVSFLKNWIAYSEKNNFTKILQIKFLNPNFYTYFLLILFSQIPRF